MSLELVRAEPADAQALAVIFFEAFHPEDPFESYIYPQGATPKAVAHELAIIERNFHDPHVQYLKVIDTERAVGDQIIAWARWKIWPQERPPAVWDVSWQIKKTDAQPVEPGDLYDIDTLMETAVFDKLHVMRQKHIRGMPCIYMSALCTRPTQQRRGAAMMLLRWGIELADKESLPIFAQVSPMIMSFDREDKLGFRILDEWTLDPKERGRPQQNGHKWPLTKKLVRRDPVASQ